jgi:hypothetical protein
MPDSNFCPQCRSEIPVELPEGLCPRCLMEQMLNSEALSLSHPGQAGATINLASKSETSSAFDKLIAGVGPVSRLLLRDTLAAAHAQSGDFPSAVKWQTRAIELLSDDKKKNDYRSRLKLYQEMKLGSRG